MNTQDDLQQLKAAIEAHLAGSPVQTRDRVDNDSEWRDERSPTFHYFGNLLYRPKPQPETRPWSKPEDVPGPVCWLQNGLEHQWMIVTIGPFGVSAGMDKPFVEWVELAKPKYKYSTDRQTWLPCTCQI